MSHLQISIPDNAPDYLVDMIERRLSDIGARYQANGRSYQDDLEMTALRHVATELGTSFDIKVTDEGFTVIRMPGKSVPLI